MQSEDQYPAGKTRVCCGTGSLFDDLKLADQLYATIVRSPHAHADIITIDTRGAKETRGVHAVLTGEDYHADGLGSLPALAPFNGRHGGPMFVPPRPAIALGRVMHVGYPVAVVVADMLDTARDAAERVAVEYAPRPAVLSARDAIEPNAPQLYDDCPNNEAYFYEAGDKGRGKFNVAGQFAAADRRGVERARDQCAARRAVARDVGSQRDGACLA